jgi:hypothetical protein
MVPEEIIQEILNLRLGPRHIRVNRVSSGLWQGKLFLFQTGSQGKLPGLVNVNNKLWKIPIFNGKIHD